MPCRPTRVLTRRSTSPRSAPRLWCASANPATDAPVNPDFVDFLAALLATEARFLVVGAHALAVHGVPRATGDIDIWIDRSPPNAARVWLDMSGFGVPTALSVRRADLEVPDMVIQIGLPPRRIDVLTDVTALTLMDGAGSMPLPRREPEG